MKIAAITALFAGLAFAGLSTAQYAYPAKGQSPQKQKQDEGECSTWAIQQTGVDPSKPPPAAQAPAAAPVTGSGARARGAAAGAIVGGVTGNDTGDAAKAGAVGAASAQRGANRKAARDQQAASGQQQQDGQAAYQKARAACLEGRGYTVK